MTGIGTLWRTVRHLKREQVLGRLYRPFRPGRPDLRAAPSRRRQAPGWVVPARRSPSLVGHGRFRILNIDHDLGVRGWEDPLLDHLQRYNLHYFDDLNAADAPARVEAQRDLMARWIGDNAPGQGTGWEPYPTSLRIVNWVKWFIGGSEPASIWRASLAVQVRWLRTHLEWHLLGNHLFANAKALVFAGWYFEGDEADEWRQCGSQIIERELQEQILPDGGHFERSPMYHALALEDVLDLINLATVFDASWPLARAMRDHASRMLFCLRCLSHPDATLASFNDCAQNVAPPMAEIERYAQELRIAASPTPTDATTQFPETGYIRASRGGATLLVDVAPVGPDYLPGHAHADTLSFELSLGSRRVIVNGGTSCYGVSPRRAYERSTAAHSTVEVERANSSEVWSSFRVGRRAHPFDLAVSEFTIACAHDGYRYLPGRPVHRRRWNLEPGGLTVEDHVAPARSAAVAHYILAPGLRLRAHGGAWEITDGEIPLAVAEVEAGLGTRASLTHAPEFGLVLPVEGLAVWLIEGHARLKLTWTGDAHSVSH